MSAEQTALRAMAYAMSHEHLHRFIGPDGQPEWRRRRHIHAWPTGPQDPNRTRVHLHRANGVQHSHPHDHEEYR